MSLFFVHWQTSHQLPGLCRCLISATIAFAKGRQVVNFRKTTRTVPPTSGGSKGALTWVITPFMPADSAAHPRRQTSRSSARGLWVAFVWRMFALDMPPWPALTLGNASISLHSLSTRVASERRSHLRSLQALAGWLLHTKTLSFRTPSLKCIDFVLSLSEFLGNQWQRQRFAIGSLLGCALHINPNKECRWQDWAAELWCRYNKASADTTVHQDSWVAFQNGLRWGLGPRL